MLSSTTFIEVDTSHRIVQFRILHIVILTYISKVTQYLEIYKYILSGPYFKVTNFEV